MRGGIPRRHPGADRHRGVHRRALAGLLLFAVAGLVAPSLARRVALARDRAFMRVPLLSGLIENGETATLARTLGTMVKNGVPLLQALEVAGNSLSNRAMSRRCSLRRPDARGRHPGRIAGSGAYSPSCRSG